jgi:hypothetical protein
MSKAAKRKLQPTDDTAMTTEQLAEKAIRDVEQMSPEEKAELRAIIDREFGRGGAALRNYDGKGKPVN